MSGVAVAVAGGAVLGAVVSSQSASKAASAQESAAATASATELQIARESAALTAPWREKGEEALNVLAERVMEGPGEFVPEQEPGYRFGYQEAVEKPLLRGAAARGDIGGGRTMKELTRYASDYATTKYDNFLDRWYRSLNPLQSLAGVGQTTSQQAAQNLLSTGQSVGQNILAGGQARASGYINQGNIYGGAISGIGQNALDAYMMNKYNTPYYGGGTGPSGAFNPNLLAR